MFEAALMKKRGGIELNLVAEANDEYGHVVGRVAAVTCIGVS